MTERTAVSLAMGNPARWAPIVESAASGVLAPNLRDYEIALHGRLGVDVPERDDVEFASLNSAVDYLARRLDA